MAPQVRLVNKTRLLPLAYGDVEPGLLHTLEQVCRPAGVALGDLEMLGQDADTCRAFLDAADEVGVPAALERVDWDALDVVLGQRGD